MADKTEFERRWDDMVWMTGVLFRILRKEEQENFALIKKRFQNEVPDRRQCPTCVRKLDYRADDAFGLSSVPYWESQCQHCEDEQSPRFEPPDGDAWCQRWEVWYICVQQECFNCIMEASEFRMMYGRMGGFISRFHDFNLCFEALMMDGKMYHESIRSGYQQYERLTAHPRRPDVRCDLKDFVRNVLIFRHRLHEVILEKHQYNLRSFKR